VTPLGRDPSFAPGDAPDSYVLFVGAIERRKDPLAAAEAAGAVGRTLVVAGPRRDEGLARELERRGADVRGYVGRDELLALYRGAACLVFPSRYEGFGLPVLEAMACGTPVAAAPDPAVREVAGDAAVYAEGGDLAGALARALDQRERLSAAGVERARLFTWDETARLTAEVYRRVLA
jgi:glycosyltransferase involved in cell wall biosynthesis